MNNFDEDSLARLKRNDPSIEELCVQFSDSGMFDADYTSWREQAAAISENEHLKLLQIEYSNSDDSSDEDEQPWKCPKDEDEQVRKRQNIARFFEAVSRNRSIQELSIVNRPIDWGEAFTILSPFFEHNHNIRSVDILGESDRTDDNGDRSIQAIVSSLSKCNASALWSFHYRCWDKIRGESAVQLISSLGVHRNLCHLSLCFGTDNTVGRAWVAALDQLLKRPTSRLASIDITCTNLGDVGISILGNVLIAGKALKKISLQKVDGITAAGWKSFSKCLSSPDCSLEDLMLMECGLDDEGATGIARAVGTNKKVKSLGISTSPDVSSAGWVNFFNVLRDSNAAVQKLMVLENEIDDQGVAAIVAALADSLRDLVLMNSDGSPLITNRGIDAITALLQRPNCKLEKLHARIPSDNEREAVLPLVSALAHNTSLETLYLSYGNYFPTPGVEGIVANVLCDKSSLSGIYESNHVLKDFYPSISPRIKSLLQMNRNANKFEVARLKLLQYYFLKDGGVHAEEFMGMETNIMPRALAWMGRDSTGFSLLYKVVRSLPSLFELVNSNACKVAGGKRKRDPDLLISLNCKI